MTTFKVLWRTWSQDGDLFILFLNLNDIPTNLVLGLFAVFVQLELLEVIAK